MQSVLWEPGEAGGVLISLSFGFLSVKWDGTNLTASLGGLNRFSATGFLPCGGR